MTIAESIQLNKEQIARAFGVPAHMLTEPDRAAAPRYWSLCMTGENYGEVGPAGSAFQHRGEKHERVLVVEVPNPACAPSDQVGLKLIAAPVVPQAIHVAASAEQIEWSHDLQERLIAAGQDFDEHESVRQVMAEAACLLAAMTGVRAPTSGERQEGGAA